MKFDIVVVGGGPAGMAAALKSSEFGYRVALVESSERLGGILLRSIHTGFGLHYFKENLTGGEFSDRLVRKIEKENIEIFLNSYLEKIENGRNKKMKLTTSEGIKEIEAQAVIFATGAREKNRFEIGILGDRTSGIYTAGEAQAMMDLYGILPGERILIVGSGDAGLIMARRFALEGCEVVGVVEILPHPGWSMRNVAQCLYDFDIPLLLEHRVVEIRGRKRVEKALVENLRTGERRWVECDTVIIAAGLIPKVKKLKKIGAEMDEKTGGPIVDEYFQTSVSGIFAAGNCVMINDLVDYAVEQGETAARGADLYIRKLIPKNMREIIAGKYIRYFIPQRVVGDEPFFLYGRIKKEIRDAKIILNGNVIHGIPMARASEMFRFKIRIKIENPTILEAEGEDYTKSEEYGKEEYLNLKRTLITVVPCRNGDLPVVSVKTDKPIPKKLLRDAMRFLSEVEVEAPKEIGDIVVKNILNTGADVVITRRCSKL